MNESKSEQQWMSTFLNTFINWTDLCKIKCTIQVATISISGKGRNTMAACFITDDFEKTIQSLKVGVAFGTIFGFLFGVFVTGAVLMVSMKKYKQRYSLTHNFQMLYLYCFLYFFFYHFPHTVLYRIAYHACVVI
jgi:hypothetical protein